MRMQRKITLIRFNGLAFNDTDLCSASLSAFWIASKLISEGSSVEYEDDDPGDKGDDGISLVKLLHRNMQKKSYQCTIQKIH